MMYIIHVTGIVQGVGFRPSVKRTADRLGTSGFVRNDGSHVTILCDTDPSRFIAELKRTVGPMARIEDWTYEEVRDTSKDRSGFKILSSRDGERDSSLPPDTAICKSCLNEMMTEGNRRYLYPFTNCTDCGARYTLIEGLPYDRERTSMAEFDMCDDCREEYGDSTFRRFHAQTLSCPENGPKYGYLNHDLEQIASGRKAFERCAADISVGKMVMVKGWGGMHIVCDPRRIDDLRIWYDRPHKPFAVMARDLEAAQRIAKVEDHEKNTLISPARPIVLLRKRVDIDERTRNMLGSISPGMDTVGTYLPYSGIHHLLFRELVPAGIDSLIMTSANPPAGPMAISLEAAADMGADGYLVHDRRISARCDDSVLVPHPFDERIAHSMKGPFGIRAFPIRKARGMIPDPLPMPHDSRVIAFGAERNVTITVTRSNKAFTSPYVGNSRHPDVLDFASETAERFRNLFGVERIDAVLADRHPRYETLRIARELAEREGVPLIRFQHHEAHASSLLVDSGVNAMPVIVLDGVGYGNDGLPWGGEVMGATYDSVKKIAGLERFGLPGGDASVYHPERIAAWLCRDSGTEPDIGTEKERKMLAATQGNAVMTSSIGRLLDALSALMLGVTWRTYDGEPAMRLESLLASSTDPQKELFDLPLNGDRIDVKGRWKVLLEELFGGGISRLGPFQDRKRSADLAMGMVGSIITDMVKTAHDNGEGDQDDEGAPYIGISGGVAYDIPIVKAFIEACREFGSAAVLHSRVPPGDGGVSVGQAALYSA